MIKECLKLHYSQHRSILWSLSLLALANLLGGCYIGPGAPIFSLTDDSRHHVYKLYPGKELPKSQLATVELTSAYYAQIDGLLIQRADYQEVLLLPGEHEIRRLALLIHRDPYPQRGCRGFRQAGRSSS